jgi:hypothetical protein
MTISPSTGTSSQQVLQSLLLQSSIKCNNNNQKDNNTATVNLVTMTTSTAVITAVTMAIELTIIANTNLSPRCNMNRAAYYTMVTIITTT